MPVEVEKSRLGRLEPLDGGEGGFGRVYHAPDVRLTHVNVTAAVYKEYRPERRREISHTRLRDMVEFLYSMTSTDGNLLVSIAAWPACVVTEQGELAGFIMPLVPDDFFDIIAPPRQAGSNEMLQVRWLLRHDDWLARASIKLTDKGRYGLLHAAAEALRFLHENQICVGDVSPRNLVFSKSILGTNPAEPRVMFIDCDSMNLRGASAAPQAETVQWTMPDGEPSGTEYSDRYKFGLLALRLLAGDPTLYASNQLSRNIPPPIRNLVKASLTAKATDRPKPEDWLSTLNSARDGASTSLPKLDPSTRITAVPYPTSSVLKTAPARTYGTTSPRTAPKITLAAKGPRRAQPTVHGQSHSTNIAISVLCALSGFLLGGGIGFLVAGIPAVLVGWILDLIFSWPGHDTVVGIVAIGGLLIGGFRGAGQVLEFAEDSPGLALTASLIILGLIGTGTFYWLTYEANKRAFAEFQFVETVVAESIRPQGNAPVRPGVEFVGPRKGIALKVRYRNAIPGKTEFFIRLFAQRNGRNRQIGGCTGFVGENPHDGMSCNLEDVELGIGNYRFSVTARTAGERRSTMVPFLIRNSQGVLAARIQRRLAELDYNVGSIDGVAGSNTSAAIMQFQRDRGHPIDGQVTDVLANMLEALNPVGEASRRMSRNQAERTPFSLIPPGTRIELTRRAFPFCTRVCKRGKHKVWIRPLAMTVGKSNVTVHLSADNPSDVENFLIFPVVDSPNYSERIHLTDTTGRKYYAINGLEGGGRERFNRKATKLLIGSNSSIEFTVRFPMPAAGVEEVSLVSPSLRGHQKAWRIEEIVGRSTRSLSEAEATARYERFSAKPHIDDVRVVMQGEASQQVGQSQLKSTRSRPREIAATVSYRDGAPGAQDIVVLTDSGVVLGANDFSSFSSIKHIELLSFSAESSGKSERWSILVVGRARGSYTDYSQRINCRDNKIECERFYYELTKAFDRWKRNFSGT